MAPVQVKETHVAVKVSTGHAFLGCNLLHAVYAGPEWECTIVALPSARMKSHVAFIVVGLTDLNIKP